MKISALGKSSISMAQYKPADKMESHCWTIWLHTVKLLFS